MGIGEAIQGQQQRRLTKGSATLHQGMQIKRFRRSGLQSNALMHSTAAELTESGPSDLLDQHTRGLGIPEQLKEFR